VDSELSYRGPLERDRGAVTARRGRHLDRRGGASYAGVDAFALKCVSDDKKVMGKAAWTKRDKTSWP